MTALATSPADVMSCTVFSTDSSRARIADGNLCFKFVCYQILHNSTVIYMAFLNLCKQFISAVGQSISGTAAQHAQKSKTEFQAQAAEPN